MSKTFILCGMTYLVVQHITLHPPPICTHAKDNSMICNHAMFKWSFWNECG